MKLVDYLAGDESATPPRPRETAMAFAARIGASAPLVSAYCKGAVWPSKDKMEAIVAATGGLVTANDFLTSPAEAVQ